MLALFSHPTTSDNTCVAAKSFFVVTAASFEPRVQPFPPDDQNWQILRAARRHAGPLHAVSRVAVCEPEDGERRRRSARLCLHF